jgi:hypothetical protein
MAIIVGVRIRSFFVSSLMMIHFGRNPVSGGSPLSDKSEMSSIRVTIGAIFQEWARVSVFELWLIIVNMVIVEYR